MNFAASLPVVVTAAPPLLLFSLRDTSPHADPSMPPDVIGPCRQLAGTVGNSGSGATVACSYRKRGGSPPSESNPFRKSRFESNAAWLALPQNANDSDGRQK